MEKIKYEINSNIARITMDDGKAYAVSKERMRKKDIEEARILMESEIDALSDV